MNSPTALAANGSRFLYRRAILCRLIKRVPSSYPFFLGVKDLAIRS